jgi:hypothetical protein
VKAHRAASGANLGEQQQAIGFSRGGRSSKIHAIVNRQQDRPLNYAVTGGQVYATSRVVSDVLDTPRPPLAVTAKAYDSEKVRQQIKDEGALRSSPAVTSFSP